MGGDPWKPWSGGLAWTLPGTRWGDGVGGLLWSWVRSAGVDCHSGSFRSVA